MDVLGEILTWSKNRPDWQRDALRRLVVNDELVEEDIDALTEICKSAHGLAGEQKIDTLAEKHLPRNGAASGRVNVDSICHTRGVNALAENQTLEFGSGLTVVYGDNAAGKSGYIRIFKSACRARGTEDILGNVLSGSTPLSPIVSIRYTVGEGPAQVWPGQEDDESLSRVSVFDRHSEAVYTTQKTDVAFRPFGLDLFDNLSKACVSVRSRLEREQRDLTARKALELELPEETAAAKFVARLSSLTKPEEVKTLGSLSESELKRLELIRKQRQDIKANDPKKKEQELKLRENRLVVFAQHLRKIDTALCSRTIKSVFDAKKRMNVKMEDAKKLRRYTFSPDLLSGTGSESWSEMWEAGRRFSVENAYPELPFPFTGDGARCVLCQRDLETDTASRLRQFEEYVTSTAERDSRAAIKEFDLLQKELNSLIVSDRETEQTINDLSIEDEVLATEVSKILLLAAERRSAIVKSLSDENTTIKELTELQTIIEKVQTLAEQLSVRAATLSTGTTVGQEEVLSSELKELESRQTLGTHIAVVLEEIERMKRLAAYELCLADTRTHSITTKSSEVTKEAVTEQLKTAFQEELEKLNFKHVEVELREAGGQSGSFYHQLVLTRAPGVELPKVISEGEARCLSIAAFFAELSTADDPSAILLDDPVSSFDYKWRDSVAQRLVYEAEKRQVIVFTHDIVFLLLLRQYAGEQNVEMTDQHVRQLQIGAGVCDTELPWVAMPVGKRIGFLKNEWQQAEKLFREGDLRNYEREAAHLYGILREAWERGLEEVLLCGVVERYRTGVQTRQISNIADISPEDCNAVDVAMTKTSRWLPGHDQAPAARQEMPEPDELKVDIDALENWVSEIRARRR